MNRQKYDNELGLISYIKAKEKNGNAIELFENKNALLRKYPLSDYRIGIEDDEELVYVKKENTAYPVFSVKDIYILILMAFGFSPSDTIARIRESNVEKFLSDYRGCVQDDRKDSDVIEDAIFKIELNKDAALIIEDEVFSFRSSYYDDEFQLYKEFFYAGHSKKRKCGR